MKIVIVNYRYFISGGPERYMFNLKELLEQHGHHIIPFSIRYAKNQKSEYEKYFVQPLSSENEVYFRDQSWTIKSFYKTIERAFYSPEVYKNFVHLINDTKPDFAIVLHYGRKLSPAVISALHDTKIPFVVRLSDFGMVCANSHMLRNEEVCEICVKGNRFNSVKHKCVQDSLGASLVDYAASRFQSIAGFNDKVKYYVVPSRFTRSKMIEAGYDEQKFIHVPTFVKTNGKISMERKKQILFVGRIEKTKGVHVLLDAVKILQKENNMNFDCILAGFGSEDYVNEQKKFIEENELKNIQFTGYIEKNKIDELISESLFTVSPSIWYDNMPNSVLESLALGTPVIASDHGSFTELIDHEKTGLLFKPGDSNDLAEKMKTLLSDTSLSLALGKNAFERASDYHSGERHYKSLMEIYNRLTGKN